MAAISRCLANGSLSPLSSPTTKHHRSRLRILSSAVRSSSDSNKIKINLSCSDLSKWNSSGLSIDERWRERRRDETAGVVQCSAGLEGIGERVARQRGGVAISERAKVVAMMALVMLLCNADRVVMSVAVVPLAAQYGWSSSFVGIVQSSFLWGYVISSMVGGTLADRYGGKRVMACAAALWSLATFLTPLAAHKSTAALLAVRALFGLAEGVAFPTMSTFLPRWFPTHERATAVGISMAGFHLGNVISFLATPIIMSSIGINGTFAFFASLGYAWLCVWLLFISNEPHDSPHISQAELELIQAGRTESKSKSNKFPSLKLLMSKIQMWAIVVANVVNNWGYFVLLSWMPVYFKTVYDVNLKQAAWFSAIPWAVMALSGYVAGASADFLIKSGFSVTLVRKIVQSIGFVGPGVALLCLSFAKTPAVAALLMTIALSLSSFSQAGYFCNVQDVAPKYAGSLHGITNGIGTVAAIISTIGTGYFVQWLGSFQAFLTLTAVLYFSATVFYNLYATGDLIFS
ncbi:phosphate transporter 4 [Rhynchospora pubera]|uniref:Phosphate transporter 4 n=1 Tax=Rhynchospora pubera TaxID=906938 RepID=A0AAV8HVM4_9POAL|nr:phosphate transporter 4 [Rhynchospora pubera]KAJ4819631.1 phosphate transporter 4 [Rhynchospora pubera]